jgi:hypothetical protein
METLMAAQFLDLVEEGKFKIEYKNFTEDSTDTPSIKITWDETEPVLNWWTDMSQEEHVTFIETLLELACVSEKEKETL